MFRLSGGGLLYFRPIHPAIGVIAVLLERTLKNMRDEELIFRPDPDIELKSVWSWSILAGAGLWRRMGVI